MGDPKGFMKYAREGPKRKPVELPPEEAWMTPGEGFRRVEQGEALDNLRDNRDEGRRTRRRDVSPD